MTGNLRHTALDWLLRVQQNPGDARLRAELAAWLASDASHVEAYRKAERVWQLTGQAQPMQSRASTTTPPAPPIAPTRPARTRPRRRSKLLAAALTACLLIYLAPSIYLSYASDYRTGAEQHLTVELGDGSRIQMDGQTALAVSYSDNRRDVRLLAGQALFEVAPDPTRPFTVAAESLQIRVTGTAFNVAIRPSQLTVAVQHGSVHVAEGDTTLADALREGDRLRWRNHDEVIRDRLPSTQVATWQQGRLIVRDERIADVLEELSPRLPGKLLLRDPALGEQRVTGVYDLHDPDAALRAVLQPYKGQVHSWGDWLRVIERQP